MQKIGRVIWRAACALRSAQGRFTSGVAAMLMLVWLLWPSEPWRLEPEPLMAFALAFIAWLFSLAEPGRSSSVAGGSNHDRGLFDRFKETLQEDERQFLREHDFGGAFDRARMSGIREISATWRGASFEFDDPALEAEFTPLLQAIQTFSTDVARMTNTLRGQTDFVSAVSEKDREGEWSERTVANIKKMNNDAEALTARLDAFIRTARKALNS